MYESTPRSKPNEQLTGLDNRIGGGLAHPPQSPNGECRMERIGLSIFVLIVIAGIAGVIATLVYGLVIVISAYTVYM